MSRTITCQCGHQVSAADDEQLVGALKGHLAEDHPDLDVPEEALRAQVESEATDSSA